MAGNNEMPNRHKPNWRLIFELAVHEVRAQQRETFFGVAWMILWPLIQAGGFMMAFSLIRGGGLGEDLLVTYIGVLTWSAATMMAMNSLGFFSRNSEMIKHMVFPFHLIMVNEVNVRFVFFALQLLIAVAIYLGREPGVSPMAVFVSVVLYLLSLYLIVVALAWLSSLVGAILPDLSLALPPVLILLLALSPVFHRDLTVMPAPVLLLNEINPFSQFVVALYGCLGLYGAVEAPYAMMLWALLAFLLTRLVVRRLYQEMAKVV
jgi:ABC-type polysaccharide/polyol phosphate export permease